MIEQQLMSCEINYILIIGDVAQFGTTKFNLWQDKLNKTRYNIIAFSTKVVFQAALHLSYSIITRLICC
uniref:Uncharacterized protein n=1 Tax=Physcomitrium patens TaxID=3218 RepID=A0A2K1KLM7_PHYPA|nr:hypothetical protein PHYPA_005575 [Physcomitrium patens]